jgi:hypothetical protein
MRRLHLAVAAGALLLCTFATRFLQPAWFDPASGLFIDRADAQGFSKEQMRVIKGKEKKRQEKMEKRMMKKKMKARMKWKMKGKWKNRD